ncbi:2-C-methyl-D-erythritol 4-phosphate cytidylyltransferase [bacterium]|nr:2-C-methyl-D-erythritol 4-phosphate cytidylyltransferase [bacterium]
MKNVALILASGTGSRCGLNYPKQFAQINGKTVLEYTIEKFENNSSIDSIYLVTNEEYVSKVSDLSKNYSKVVSVVKGGETRKDSSYNGIFSIKESECNVLIHDGVRPFVSDEIINRCVEALKTKDAVCVTIDSTDTIFNIDERGIIKDIPNRNFIKRAQTPQCFKLSVIKKAHQLANSDKHCYVTDDCGLIMHYNLADIYTIDGSIENIKITYKEDLEKLTF